VRIIYVVVLHVGYQGAHLLLQTSHRRSPEIVRSVNDTTLWQERPSLAAVAINRQQSYSMSIYSDDRVFLNT